MKKYLLFVITAVITLTTVVNAVAQGTVRGKVVDATTKESLPGATVLVKGTTNAVPTSLDGSFSVNINKPGTSSLLINFICDFPK